MPNTRLVWNFELKTSSGINVPTATTAEPISQEDMRCEYRLFYPENTIITLSLPQEFEHLSLWKYTERTDTYYLIPGQDLNIKSRHEKLVFKPELHKQDHIVWFGRKQRMDKSDFRAAVDDIPQELAERMRWLMQKASLVYVEKEAFVTSLFDGKLRFEIAKLRFEKRLFFTIGLEAKASSYLFPFIALLDHRNATKAHYVSFLKTQMGIPL